MESLLNLWTIQDIKSNLMSKEGKHQMWHGAHNIYQSFFKNISLINKMFYFQLLMLIHGYHLYTYIKSINILIKTLKTSRMQFLFLHKFLQEIIWMSRWWQEFLIILIVWLNSQIWDLITILFFRFLIIQWALL